MFCLLMNNNQHQIIAHRALDAQQGMLRLRATKLANVASAMDIW